MTTYCAVWRRLLFCAMWILFSMEIPHCGADHLWMIDVIIAVGLQYCCCRLKVMRIMVFSESWWENVLDIPLVYERLRIVKIKGQVYSLIANQKTYQPTLNFLPGHYTCYVVWHFNSTESIQSCSHFGALGVSYPLPPLPYHILIYTWDKSSEACECKVTCPWTQHRYNVPILRGDNNKRQNMTSIDVIFCPHREIIKNI